MPESTKKSNGSASGEAESYPALQWREEPPHELGTYRMRFKSGHGKEVNVHVVESDDIMGTAIRLTDGKELQQAHPFFNDKEFAGPITSEDEAESAG